MICLMIQSFSTIYRASTERFPSISQSFLFHNHVSLYPLVDFLASFCHFAYPINSTLYNFSFRWRSLLRYQMRIWFLFDTVFVSTVLHTYCQVLKSTITSNVKIFGLSWQQISVRRKRCDFVSLVVKGMKSCHLEVVFLIASLLLCLRWTAILWFVQFLDPNQIFLVFWTLVDIAL